MKSPHDIGCKEQHLYCQSCTMQLFNHFSATCPQCKERNLKIQKIKSCKFIERLICSLTLNIPLRKGRFIIITVL